jgi:hypothetical protein
LVFRGFERPALMYRGLRGEADQNLGDVVRLKKDLELPIESVGGLIEKFQCEDVGLRVFGY